MNFLLIILQSTIFTIIFVALHLLFIHLFSFSFKKTLYLFDILIPFILSNLILIYFVRETELYKLFYNFFIINFAILILYWNVFLFVIRGFTLSILNLFKKKRKLSYKELIKNYAEGKGARWKLVIGLNRINQLKIIRINKKISLTSLGRFLSIILIFLRKILAIRDLG